MSSKFTNVESQPLNAFIIIEETKNIAEKERKNGKEEADTGGRN